MKIDVHHPDDEHQSGTLEFFVRDPRCAEHFHAASFKVAEVIAVMNSPLTIDFMVVDSNRCFVLRNHGDRLVLLPSTSFQVLRQILCASKTSLLGGQSDWGWEFDHEFGAATDFALNTDPSTVGFDDFPRGRKSESGAFGFGRVKGFEHAHGGGFIHSASCIDHVHGDTLGGDVGLDVEFTAIGHGFDCVLDQVDQCGLECAAIESNIGEIGIEQFVQMDVLFIGLGLEQIQHNNNLVVERTDRQFHVLHASEA